MTRSAAGSDDRPPVPAESSAVRALAALCPLVPLALIPLTLCGCGGESYSKDLTGNTVPYFALQRELNANLAGPYEARGIGLRVPASFRFVDPPKPPTDEEREDEYYQPPPDERQAAYLRRDLPGMRAAWRFAGAPGQPGGERWLYLLDSRDLEDDPEEPGLEPAELPFAVTDRFAEAFNVPTPPIESFRPARYPAAPTNFAPAVNYRVPPEVLVGEIEGTEHTAEVYVHENRGRHLVLVLVAPTETLTSDRGLTTARDLMLQTLEVSNARRSAPARTPSPGGAGF